MESTSFFFEHAFEIRLLLVVLAIAGGFALIQLYSLLSRASDAVFKKYSSIDMANAGSEHLDLTTLRQHALGSR